MTSFRMLTIAFFLTGWLAAQETTGIPRNEAGKYEYVEVVNVPDLTADEIFRRATAWIHSEYKNPAKKIQVRDPAARRIVLKHKVRVPRPVKKGNPYFFVYYKLSVEAKDGRYRYRIFKLHENRGGNRLYPIERWTDKHELPPRQAKMYLEYLDHELRALAARLKQYIAAPPVEKGDDW